LTACGAELIAVMVAEFVGPVQSAAGRLQSCVVLRFAFTQYVNDLPLGSSSLSTIVVAVEFKPTVVPTRTLRG
jgi:hypothetical protein